MTRKRHPGYIIGKHWLETAYDRICAGEPEHEVLADYDVVRREAECHCGLMARVNELEEALLRERDRKLEEGWRQCAVGQGTTQFCAMTEEAVKAEREACLSILRDMEGKKWHTVIHGGEMKGVSLHDAYAAIRARGNSETL